MRALALGPCSGDPKIDIGQGFQQRFQFVRMLMGEGEIAYLVGDVQEGNIGRLDRSGGYVYLVDDLLWGRCSVPLGLTTHIPCVAVASKKLIKSLGFAAHAAQPLPQGCTLAWFCPNSQLSQP